MYRRCIFTLRIVNQIVERMKAITITKLRKNIRTYFDQVTENSDVIIVPRNDDQDAAVVLISLAEYNSLTETDYLLSNETNRSRLLESIDQLDKGEGLVMTEFDD